jgi:hypothetical protein
VLLTAARIRVENTLIVRHPDRYEVKQYSTEVDPVGVKISDFNGKPVYVTKRVTRDRDT